METTKQRVFFVLLRLSLGWLFFWGFVDKLFGLGFATCVDKKTGAWQVMCQSAWASGGSPAMGFLKFGVKGPFADFYHSLAGNPIIDWLFMLGLGGIGLALILGVAVRFASYSGVFMMILMYFALITPENNPIIDEHIVYALCFFGLAEFQTGDYFGLGRWWRDTALVKKLPFLG